MMKAVRYLLSSCLILSSFSGIQAQDDQTPTPQWRAVYHFTPEKNWTNDPNGLLYTGGKYHMYNQQNPFENKWGHMSWGHATSTDLVHWDHLAIAMPETIGKDTNWIFSGSAVKDTKNSSGFCKTPDCIVAIYTSHQPNLKKESQAVAYSNDGGLTFTNYEGNPVIDLHKKDFRDPSVSWNEQLQQWVMVVVLPSEHTAQFYASDDLKKWTLSSEFTNAGFRESNWECPSLVKLPVEGKPGLFKWVLFISAAGKKNGVYMQYFVGNFDGKTFTNDNPPDTVLTVDFGDSYYAAIPWNDQPEHQEIMIGWIVPGKQPTFPWRGQMSIPRDLGVRATAAGYRLIQRPTTVIESKLASLSAMAPIQRTNIRVSAQEQELTHIPGNAFWLDATLSLQGNSNVAFKLGQKKDAQGRPVTETIVGYDAATRQCYVDRSLSGQAAINKIEKRQTATLDGSDSTIRIQILFDKSSLEVFFGNGEKGITSYIFPDADADGLSVVDKNGNAVIKNLTIWNLSGLKK